MTTRAGLAGLITGLLLSAALFYPLYYVWPDICVNAEAWQGHSWMATGLLAMAAAILTVFGSGLAAAWSGAAQPRRIWLGALAGWIAAIILFCSLGAAAAGTPGLGHSFRDLGNHGLEDRLATETVLQIARWTHRTFWGLTLAGVLLGALGGWRFAPASIMQHFKSANKNDPMMALNVSITAMPAAALAAILAVALFSRLSDLLRQNQIRAGVTPVQPLQIILNWPLTTAMLLYLASQLALMLTTSHEAKQADHRCGLDEIKVAAYVGILTPVLFIMVLGLINLSLLFVPFVLGCLLISLSLAVRQIVILCSVILPRRAQMQAPRDPLEATFFGTIATSHWQSLSLLCLGCSILIVAPIYIAMAAAISIAFIPNSTGPTLASVIGISAPTPVGLIHRLYQAQAIAGLGSILIVTLILTAMYLFYNSLGRRFRDIRQESHDARNK
ncbi:MAG: hypothetical protein JXA21_24485 [Anaerolineae bacterium]|nr:hypothetical protein [Anaerolineae bacterium]